VVEPTARTTPNGSASVVEPTARITSPKKNKVDTSSVEDPTAQALVARSGSKVLNDNFVNDNPDLMNFAAVEFEIVCRMSFWL
jgi:hypothetical protein